MPPTRILNLATDYARYGLTKDDANKILGNRFTNRWDATNRVQGRIEVLVPHIQDGWPRGSLEHWARGRGIQASSNTMTDQDGTLIEIIPDQHGPWTNGKVDRPTAKGLTVITRGGNPNVWSWTLEAAGTLSTAFTPEQWETICWTFDRQLKKYPHLDPRKDIMGHRHIDSRDRPNCGLYDERLIAELVGDHRPALDKLGTLTRYASPIVVKVTAGLGLNIRQWGELDQPVIDYAPAGATMIATGHVIGSTVDGIAEWYIDPTGRRFWSGGTNRPNLP